MLRHSTDEGLTFFFKWENEKAILDLKKAVDLGHQQAREFLKEKFNIDYEGILKERFNLTTSVFLDILL